MLYRQEQSLTTTLPKFQVKGAEAKGNGVVNGHHRASQYFPKGIRS